MAQLIAETGLPNEFRGTLKCTFLGCSVFAVVKIWKEKKYQLEICYSGKLRHRGGVHHGMRIKGAALDEIKRVLDVSELFSSEQGAPPLAVQSSGEGVCLR